MSGAEFALIAVTITLAAGLQSSIGFGLGLFAAPVIALVDPTLLPGAVVILGTSVALLVAVRERASIDFRGAGWAMVGRLPGTAVGAVLVATLPTRGLSLFLAASVLAGVGLSIAGWRPEPRRRAVVAAGLASGVMGTATAIGGPPMALVWQGSSGPRMRGTMSAYFIAGSVFSLVALLAVGALEARTVTIAVALVPALVLGFVLSRLVRPWLDANRLRSAALAVSAAGAVLVVVAG